MASAFSPAWVPALGPPSAAGLSPSGFSPVPATDGADVHSLVLVVSPAEAHEEHIAILKWIAAIARSDYYSKVLRNTADPGLLYSLFLETDGTA